MQCKLPETMHSFFCSVMSRRFPESAQFISCSGNLIFWTHSSVIRKIYYFFLEAPCTRTKISYNGVLQKVCCPKTSEWFFGFPAVFRRKQKYLPLWRHQDSRGHILENGLSALHFLLLFKPRHQTKLHPVVCNCRHIARNAKESVSAWWQFEIHEGKLKTFCLANIPFKRRHILPAYSEPEHNKKKCSQAITLADLLQQRRHSPNAVLNVPSTKKKR